ncbi:NAD(P)H-binding protein [Limosilactobacillus sp.]|uniref:NAD(P)H-binding protein n=1 Tax=Limosilactobacillus sp. TaxID=2773925 RepID=UPI003F098BC6
MKIFVVGGSGRVATALIRDLVTAGHTVTAGSRHPERIIKAKNVTPVRLDLHDELTELKRVIGHPDVLYFTAGSNGSDLLRTDAMGAIKTMKVAEENNIHRYIMLSAMFPLEPAKWRENGLMVYADYKTAKFFADNYLVNQTDLDYTILSPTNLTTETGTGRITIDSGKVATNPIPDVALTLAKILDHPNTVRKVMMMRTGNTPIDDALVSVK